METLYYGYTDNQGSLIALTDVSGNVVEKYAYDPWGARRNPNDWTQNDSRTAWITNRGYTGHEHLDAFGIINMNGRVYDPLTAQFFSPDPFIQSGSDWKNYNRYSYCLNNPTRNTDPSGYIMAQQNTAWFNPSYENFMYYAYGGGSSTLENWSDHQGSISYDWDSGKYEYASGAEASYDEVYNNYILPHSWLTVSGRDAGTVYNNVRYGDQATNRALANIGNSIKNYIANIENEATAAWNNMVSLIGGTEPISDIWNSLTVRAYIADTYQVGLSADVCAFIGCGTSPINFTLKLFKVVLVK